MNDRYDKLRVSPDHARAEELRRRLHAQLEHRALDDATASTRRFTIASPPADAEFEPMEEMHMSQTEHRNRWRNLAVAAAAAVIVVVGVGAILGSRSSNSNSDDPDGVPQAPVQPPAPTTTVAPRTYPLRLSDLSITYTLPNGWDVPAGSGEFLLTSESSVVNMWQVANVYADGCAHTQLDPPLGPTVDDLATVWATLPGFTATTPVDITVDGYPGKRVEYTVPDYATAVNPVTNEVGADCVNATFALWDEIGSRGGPSFWAQVPGSRTGSGSSTSTGPGS